MKQMNLVKSTAIAAVLALTASVHAASIINDPGDVILGFQDASNSIQFDIGALSPVLTAMNGATTDLGSFNINTALSATGFSGAGGQNGYGANWASNSGISWTVASQGLSGTNSFYTGMGQTTPLATLGSGPATANSILSVPGDAPAAQLSLGSMISGMQSLLPGNSIKAGTGNTLAGKFLNSQAAAIAKIDLAGTATAAFGNAFQNASLLNTSVTNTAVGTAGLLAGKTYSAVDLYSFTNNGAAVDNSFLGTLALTNAGEVFFVSAIPEPSTYAMILGVATLGFAAIRRRKQVQLFA